MVGKFMSGDQIRPAHLQAQCVNECDQMLRAILVCIEMHICIRFCHRKANRISFRYQIEFQPCVCVCRRIGVEREWLCVCVCILDRSADIPTESIHFTPASIRTEFEQNEN